MRDPRVTALAQILVRHSTKVAEGDVCTIEGESAAEPLLQAVYEEVLEAGGNPIVNMGLEGQSAAYFEHASDKQLEWISPVAEWAIVPLQDILALGSEARMNFPGSTGENWSWRYREDQLGPEHADRLAELTTIYGRAPKPAQGATTP